MALTINSISADNGQGFDIEFLISQDEDSRMIEQLVNAMLIWRNVREIPDYSEFKYAKDKRLIFRIDAYNRQLWDTFLITIENDQELFFQPRQITTKVIRAKRHGLVILA